MKTTIDNFLIASKSNGVILFDKIGKLHTSMYVDYADSITLLSHSIKTMCEKFVLNTNWGQFENLHVKSSEGLIIFNKLDDNYNLVVFSKQNTNLALLLNEIEKLKSDILLKIK